MSTINFSKKTISLIDAQNIFSQFDSNKAVQYNNQDQEFRSLLLPLVSLYSDLQKDGKEQSRKKYYLDVSLGLAIYELLPPKVVGLRNASNNSFWRYVSLIVLPDLVFSRWGLSPDRFWKKSNRLWPKVLWWYVHLSLQKNYSTTFRLLLSEKKSTDTIVQLVERSGYHGYRIDLYREIMWKAYKAGLDQNEFRALMTLVTVKTVTIEPRFTTNGIQGFVYELIESIKN